MRCVTICITKNTQLGILTPKNIMLKKNAAISKTAPVSWGCRAELAIRFILIIVMIVMNVGAAVMCVAAKDYKKAVYWIAAAVLNACVTF